MATQATPDEIALYLTCLEETPVRLAALAGGLDAAQIWGTGDKCADAPALTLAHLRGCDEVWTFSVYAALNEPKPAMPAFHPWRWIKARRFLDLDFAPSLQAFTLQRAELLLVLRDLPPAAWNRPFQWGDRSMTILMQIRRLALHERGHCDQLEAALKQKKETTP